MYVLNVQSVRAYLLEVGRHGEENTRNWKACGTFTRINNRNGSKQKKTAIYDSRSIPKYKMNS